MKLTRIISLFVVAIVALSCNKDDDGVDAYNYNKANLTGTYSVSAFKSKEVKTVKVEGFDVETTIVITGDTFGVSFIFDSTDILTMDGLYRIVKVKTQNNKTDEESEIIDLDNKKTSYVVNAQTSELTIGKKVYKVSNFSRTGFKINHENSTVGKNGETTKYTEEWVFKK